MKTNISEISQFILEEVKKIDEDLLASMEMQAEEDKLSTCRVRGEHPSSKFLAAEEYPPHSQDSIYP